MFILLTFFFWTERGSRISSIYTQLDSEVQRVLPSLSCSYGVYSTFQPTKGLLGIIRKSMNINGCYVASVYY